MAADPAALHRSGARRRGVYGRAMSGWTHRMLPGHQFYASPGSVTWRARREPGTGVSVLQLLRMIIVAASVLAFVGGVGLTVRQVTSDNPTVLVLP